MVHLIKNIKYNENKRPGNSGNKINIWQLTANSTTLQWGGVLQG